MESPFEPLAREKETAIVPPRKVIIDCDPGIDDAIALCVALSDPRLDVVAVTAVEGCVDAEAVTRNVENLVENFDPEKRPRLGAASSAENAIAVDTRYLHGDDGLGDIDLKGSTHLNRVSSSKLIADLVRRYPGEITVICLGPLTNLAAVLAREPATATLIDRLFIVGGALNGIGNITPAAEFNMYFDPPSAREVFHSAITKTLIPLDLTSQVDFGLDWLEQFASASRCKFLLPGLQQFFLRYRQHLGRESILLNDAVGLLAATHPGLITTDDLAGDVEAVGDITRGVTVFDRRGTPEWRTNMDVGMTIDVDGIRDKLATLLK